MAKNKKKTTRQLKTELVKKIKRLTDETFVKFEKLVDKSGLNVGDPDVYVDGVGFYNSPECVENQLGGRREYIHDMFCDIFASWQDLKVEDIDEYVCSADEIEAVRNEVLKSLAELDEQSRKRKSLEADSEYEKYLELRRKFEGI